MSYSTEWANVSNTPFRMYKQFIHEGGISAPMIAHWPKGIKSPNRITNQVGHLIDLMTTCVDVSGSYYPTTHRGDDIIPAEGQSIKPVFEKLNTIILLFAILIDAGIVSAQHIYNATIHEKEILTPLPQKSPRINGPKVYGVRPGKQFIYRIPCQGERPMQFKIEALPAGLLLDAENGIINGSVPNEKGGYGFVIEAKNKYGAVSREFKIVVGDKIAKKCDHHTAKKTMVRM